MAQGRYGISHDDKFNVLQKRNMRVKPAFRFGLAYVIPAMIVLSACQKERQTASEAGPDAKPGVSVSDGVLVLPAVKGNPGAAYFKLVKSGEAPTALEGVHIDGAGKAEMHETKGGMMQPVDEVQINPGETVKFERGGKHVMAFDLADSLTPGKSTEMTLTFSGGDKLSTQIKVEAAGSGGEAMGKMDHEDMH